jgi:hypothetical protein
MTTQGWLIPPDCYLIDCSSIVAFSGLDRSNPNKFLAYREKIWAHLEGMIAANRLKTVREVWPELKWLDPKSYARLHPFHAQMTMPRPQETEAEVVQLAAKYPDIIDLNPSYKLRQADPYLVVCARRNGMAIITDEKSQVERTGKRKKNKLNIPDVCNREGMRKCIHIEDFMKNEGIIPKDAILT